MYECMCIIYTFWHMFCQMKEMMFNVQMPLGMLYREDTTALNVTASAGQFLDIFIENTGRVGFSTAMNFMTKVSSLSKKRVIIIDNDGR